MIDELIRCKNKGGTKPPWEQCPNPVVADGWLCIEHGCHRCGHVILADTEEWEHPLCASCYEKLEKK